MVELIVQWFVKANFPDGIPDIRVVYDSSTNLLTYILVAPRGSAMTANIWRAGKMYYDANNFWVRFGTTAGFIVGNDYATATYSNS